LRKELALYPFVNAADALNRTRVRRTSEARREDLVLNFDGWDGQSEYGERQSAWSVRRQRRKLARQLEHLEHCDMAIRDEISKLRLNQETVEVEKRKLDIIHQTLIVENARLKENQNALESQHITLRARLKSVGNLKQKADAGHQRLKRNLDFTKTNSERLVKTLPVCEREFLRQQFVRKKEMEISCKSSLGAMHSSMMDLTQESERNKLTLEKLQAEVASIAPREPMDQTKHELLLKSIQDMIAIEPSDTSLKPTLVSDLTLLKAEVEATLRQECNIDGQLTGMRSKLASVRQSAIAAAGAAKAEFARWRQVVKSCEKRA